MQQEESTKLEIKVPKTPEEQLKQLIEATCMVLEEAPFRKSDPMRALWREGNLNFDFVMKEIELIRQKKSTLSAGKRAAVIALVGTAIDQFNKRQSGQQKTVGTKDVNNNIDKKENE